MRLSTRGHYAVMAMVELAARQQGSGCDSLRNQVSLGEIAAAQHLSLAYLEQLFGPLRRAGLVASARGPGGGCRLARPPASERCRTHDLWAELGAQIHLFLSAVTLADVVGGAVRGRAGAPSQPAVPV